MGPPSSAARTRKAATTSFFSFEARRTVEEMSLLPSCWDDWFHHRLNWDWDWDWDNDFFSHPHCRFNSTACDLFHHRHHVKWDPWCHRSCLTNKVTIDPKNGFKVIMDVHHFKPDELTVRTVGDTVIVEGKMKREVDKDTGPFCISREFSRKYRLPRGYDAIGVKSTLSSDGILAITADAPPKVEPEERYVSIEPTGSYFTTSDKDTDRK